MFYLLKRDYGKILDLFERFLQIICTRTNAPTRLRDLVLKWFSSQDLLAGRKSFSVLPKSPFILLVRDRKAGGEEP